MGAQEGKKRALPLSNILVVTALAAAVGAVFIMKQRPLHTRESVTVPVAAEVEAPPDTPSSLPRLVDLGSSRCQSCLAMFPVLEALTKEFDGRLDVVFIDVREDPEAAARYGIQLIPTQIFFDSGGKELFRHEGFFSREEILSKWEELGHVFGG